jgi:hypothetical protein
MDPRKPTHEMRVAACNQAPHEIGMTSALCVAYLEAQAKESTRQLHQK